MSLLPGVKLKRVRSVATGCDQPPNVHWSPLEVKNCWPVYHYTEWRQAFYTLQWSDIQYFLFFTLLTIKRQRKCCQLASPMNQRLRPHHPSSSPARPVSFSITEVMSTELLRPSSSSIDKHNWRPTSHWAVQGPQKTRPEALGRLKLFWETSSRANIAWRNYSTRNQSLESWQAKVPQLKNVFIRVKNKTSIF